MGPGLNWMAARAPPMARRLSTAIRSKTRSMSDFMWFHENVLRSRIGNQVGYVQIYTHLYVLATVLYRKMDVCM